MSRIIPNASTKKGSKYDTIETTLITRPDPTANKFACNK